MWCQSAQALVRTHFILHDAPCLQLALRVGNVLKHVAVEQLIAQTAVKTLSNVVVPGMSRLCIGGLHPLLDKPGFETRLDELWPIVAFDVGRSRMAMQQLGQNALRAGCRKGGCHVNRQTHAGKIIADCQDAQIRASLGGIGNEVQRPHLSGARGDDKKRLRLGRFVNAMFARPHLQAGLFPQPLDALVVDGLPLPAHDPVGFANTSTRVFVSNLLQPRLQVGVLGGTLLILRTGAVHTDEDAGATLRHAMRP